MTRGKTQPDRGFWLGRVQQAVHARAAHGLLEPEGACRLIAGDSDGIPGLVVDRYADVLVLQSGCQGSDRMLKFLVELVEEALRRDDSPGGDDSHCSFFALSHQGRCWTDSR